ncbi:hypothetical protein PanWU01x14_318210, partial [Parasponia andersonii]
ELDLLGLPIWNKQKLVGAFEPSDFRNILRIPLLAGVTMERWGWVATKSGWFSVKSALSSRSKG